ncbi:MAG: AAA family ATPase [Candidatus Cloacimonetes bacterium]|nr:AAA family ATPase [Candidatus Cloacimonadota bacterium]
MKRILVLGCSGSGKTCLALTMSEILHLPVVHLDSYYWQPGWQSTPPEIWQQIVTELCAQENWIMDGNYHSSLSSRKARADTVVYLEASRWKCFRRILDRRLRFHGRSRPDLGPDCPEQIDREFIRWIWNFNKNIRPLVFDILQENSHIDFYHLHNEKEISRFLRELKDNAG